MTVYACSLCNGVHKNKQPTCSECKAALRRGVMS